MKQKQYKYGIELEMVMESDADYGEETPLDKFITIVNRAKFDTSEDSSIDADYGQQSVEVKTEAGGVELPRLIERTNRLEKIMQKFSAETNESCGFHLHVSNPLFFKKSKIERIIKLWVSIEDVFCATQPNERHDNEYAARKLRNFVSDVNIKLPAQKDELISELGDTNRYYAINLSSMKEHGTIEIRLHEGTVIAKDVINWAKLMTAFFNYSLGASYDRKAVDALFKTTISDEKIDSVFKILEVDEDIKEHFLHRIYAYRNDYLFNQLADEQKAAFTIITGKRKIRSIENRLERLEEEVSSAENVLSL